MSCKYTDLCSRSQDTVQCGMSELNKLSSFDAGDQNCCPSLKTSASLTTRMFSAETTARRQQLSHPRSWPGSRSRPTFPRELRSSWSGRDPATLVSKWTTCRWGYQHQHIIGSLCKCETIWEHPFSNYAKRGVLAIILVGLFNVKGEGLEMTDFLRSNCEASKQ